MYNNQNISARTKSRLSKDDCFNRNIPVLNIIFYIGKGFMIRSQIITLVRIFYEVNEHKANDMLSDLLAHGLLIKKQATNTKTCIYALTKFPLAIYHECSTRDSCYIRLNNRKIWNNLYRTEFIIRQALPLMEQYDIEITLENLFSFLDQNTISIFTTENQVSIYQLYKNLFDNFPIKDKESISAGNILESDFMNDFYKCTAELYNYQTNFLGYVYNDDFSSYQDTKCKLEREKDLVTSSKELKRNYYSLSNMIASGFFFIGKPNKENIIIGIFDKCNNLSLKKIYENILCIFLMLQRYLGFSPQITLQVYMSNIDRMMELHNKELERGYDYSMQEKLPYDKRTAYFKNMKIPEQYWDNIQIDYIYYPIKEKYNL